MNVEDGIRLQAHLDGELTGREAKQVAALIENDAKSRALFAELQQTRTLLAANEPEMRLPESREFFWSKIEREIQRLETSPAGARTPAWLLFLRHHLAAVTGTSVAAALMLLMAFQMNWVSPDTTRDRVHTAGAAAAAVRRLGRPHALADGRPRAPRPTPLTRQVATGRRCLTAPSRGI